MTYSSGWPGNRRTVPMVAHDTPPIFDSAYPLGNRPGVDPNPDPDPTPVNPAVSSRSVLYVGHSLSQHISDMVHSAVAEAGLSHTFRHQNIPGASMGFQFDNPPGDNWPSQASYTAALSTGLYDTLNIVESVPRGPSHPWSADIDDSETDLLRWIDYAAPRGVQDVFFYEPWHNIDGPSQFDTVAPTRNMDWIDRVKSDAGMWRAMVNRVNAARPNTNVYLVPAGTFLAKIAELAEAGQLFGLSSNWRNEIFFDSIHITDSNVLGFHSNGAYMVALLHFAVMYRRAPHFIDGTNWTARFGETFPFTLPALLKRQVQRIIWDLVREIPETGVQVDSAWPGLNAPGVTGTIGNGQQVTLTSDGTNSFGASQGTIVIGNHPDYAQSTVNVSATVNTWSSSSITCTLPAIGAANLGDFRDRYLFVRNSGGAVVPFRDYDHRWITRYYAQMGCSGPLDAYLAYWGRDFIFRNLLAQWDFSNSDFPTRNGWSYDAPSHGILNAQNGWEASSVFLSTGEQDTPGTLKPSMVGTYVLEWDGPAQCRIEGASGGTTAWTSGGRLIFGMTSGGFKRIGVRNATGTTQANLFSNPRILKIDDYPGATNDAKATAAVAAWANAITNRTEELFDPDILALMRSLNARSWRLNGERFIYGPNSNTGYRPSPVDWAHRRRPDHSNWFMDIPYEIHLALCRATDAEPYLHTPCAATTGFLEGFADLISSEYGDELEAGRKLRTEASNEVWNTFFPYNTGGNALQCIWGAPNGGVLRGQMAANSVTVTGVSGHGLSVNDIVFPYWSSDGASEMLRWPQVYWNGSAWAHDCRVTATTADSFTVGGMTPVTTNQDVVFLTTRSSTFQIGSNNNHVGNGRVSGETYRIMRERMPPEHFQQMVKSINAQAGWGNPSFPYGSPLEIAIQAYNAGGYRESAGVLDEISPAWYVNTDFSLGLSNLDARLATNNIDFIASRIQWRVEEAHRNGHPDIKMYLYETGGHDDGEADQGRAWSETDQGGRQLHQLLWSRIADTRRVTVQYHTQLTRPITGWALLRYSDAPQRSKVDAFIAQNGFAAPRGGS